MISRKFEINRSYFTISVENRHNHFYGEIWMRKKETRGTFKSLHQSSKDLAIKSLLEKTFFVT
jgi:hypothetical protein